MNVQQKLRMILEGGISIDITNPLMETTDSYTDELSLFTESMKADFSYISSMDIMFESDSEKSKNVFARIIDWIIQKINAAITFIKNLFNKKSSEVDTLIKNVENVVAKGKHTSTHIVGYKMLMKLPEDSVNKFKDALNKVTNEVNSLISMIKEGKLPEELKHSKNSKDFDSYIFKKVFNKNIGEVSEFFEELYGKEERVDIDLNTNLVPIQKLLNVYYKSEKEFTSKYDAIKATLESIQKQVIHGQLKVDDETANGLKFACMSLIALFHGIVLNMNIAVTAYDKGLRNFFELVGENSH